MTLRRSGPEHDPHRPAHARLDLPNDGIRPRGLRRKFRSLSPRAEVRSDRRGVLFHYSVGFGSSDAAPAESVGPRTGKPARWHVDLRRRTSPLCCALLLRICRPEHRNWGVDSLRLRSGYDDGRRSSVGERPVASQWLGLGLALAGLVYLVLPGIAAPPPLSAGLMALAGLAWGIYSLRGRGAVNPVAQTTSAFVRSVPIALAMSAISFRQFHAGVGGVALAVASGTAASGMGYVAWYAALRGLTATRAAVVQLSVPIIAAVGGIIFLAEALSTRLVVAALLVLGGVALAILGRQRRSPGS